MLLSFIFGGLFIYAIMPLLQNLLSIVSAWAEYIVYLFVLKVYKIKKEMGIDQEEQEPKVEKIPMGFHTDVVGYSIDNEPEYYEEEQ